MSNVIVRNLTDNPVVYVIEEDHIRREFGPYEEKRVSVDELKKLYYKQGGAVLIRDFLQIRDRDLAIELGVDPESFDHEYSWDQSKVDTVLTNGSLDLLHDALDFAPEGIVDMIVQRAVALRIPDNNKRELIKECTGKDVSRMIANQIAVAQATEEIKDEKPATRRIGGDTKEENKPASTRRVG